MIVVDTNLIAYLLLGGEKTPSARSVFQCDPEWTAPLLWRSEFLSVLAMFMRQGKLTAERAMEFMNEAEQLMRGDEYQVDPTRVIRLADSSKCSAYDSKFVALAQLLDLPLVTSDREILDEFPGNAVAIESFGA